jgi:integrase
LLPRTRRLDGLADEAKELGDSAAANVPAALPKVRFHDLRHIHATLLLRAGVPVHVVAARLGHSDPAITLRVYAHVLADQAVSAADTFAALLDAPKEDDGEGADA